MTKKSSRKILVLLTGLFDTKGGIQTFNRAIVKGVNELAASSGWKATALVLNDQDDRQAVNRYYTPGITRYRVFHQNKKRFTWSALSEAMTSSVVFFGHLHFMPVVFPLKVFHPCCRKILILYGEEAWRPVSFVPRTGINQMDQILTISASTRNRFLQFNGIPKAPFELLTPTLDPFYDHRDSPRTRKELGLPPGKMMLTVSRLDASEGPKKIDFVIRSLPALLKKVPDLFYVVLGGPYDGSDVERLKEVTSDVGMSEKVFFVGEVSDEIRSSYYQTSDLFVLPSVKEGFGIVFLEGMYYAKPCVGANAGGVPEVIESGKTGLLIEPGSSEGLIQAVSSLLTNPALSDRMGQAGRKRLDEEFSYEIFREKLASILFT